MFDKKLFFFVLTKEKKIFVRVFIYMKLIYNICNKLMI